MKVVPATLLLGLESRLKMVRDVYAEIPTLPPGGKWVKDTNEGNDIYFNENIETRFKTAKTFVHKVLYEATKEHPAQIEKWEELVKVIWKHTIIQQVEEDIKTKEIRKKIRKNKQK